MDVYNLSLKYARQGNVDALYDLHSGESHRLFDRLADGERLKNGREFYRRRVMPMMRKVQAASHTPANAQSSYRTEVHGDRAVIRLNIKAQGAEFYPDVHLVREDGVWKLQAPKTFGLAPPRPAPTVRGGESPSETFHLATKFLREGKSEELFALYDGESRQLFEVWAKHARANDTVGFFSLKMHPMINYAGRTRFGEGVNAANFRVTIDGDRAVLHTNLPMRNVAQYEPDMKLVREGGLWKLTMLPAHRQRVDRILAQQK